MAHLFWIQFRALFWKNWIGFAQQPFLNLTRNFLAPVGLAILLAWVQLMGSKPNDYGNGQFNPAPIHNLENEFNPSLAFVWSDDTDGSTSLSPQVIIDHITSSFNPLQRAAIIKAENAAQIPFLCPQNWNGYSQCYAAVSFANSPSEASAPITYTLYGDAGFEYVSVEHRGDFDTRILPLQWAIDRAIVELDTGVRLPTPSSWIYARQTNEEQASEARLRFVRDVRDIFILAFVITFAGITYHLPGAVAAERSMLLTAHMKAMGLLDSARIVSWHLSVSLIHLPAWIVVGVIWSLRVWKLSNMGLIVIIHILFGLTLASWSFFVAAPFGKSPQLAAVVTTFLSFILSVVSLVTVPITDGPAFIVTLVFPPAFYARVIRAVCGFESNNFAPTNVLQRDGDTKIMILPQLIAAIINIFLWPYLAVLLERYLYDPVVPNTKSGSWYQFWKKPTIAGLHVPGEDTAISVRNLSKVFRASRWSSKEAVIAVEDLSFSVPKTGIFVVLGSNGAGKSTSLSILAGLDGQTGGEVLFEGGLLRPPRGTLGIVPQKNVLFNELSCLQTLRVWQAVKWSASSEGDEDLEQLLRDCDLGSKIHASASTLSGGQKRKLQLAIGFLGGSKIVLVDECTSGVDPLSRRALWRTLKSFRDDRAIVFTTHFLDEADLLADHIAILAAPGRLLASGSPISLKHQLGQGYSIQVSFRPEREKESSGPDDLYDAFRRVSPGTHTSSHSPNQVVYRVATKDAGVVQQLLDLLDSDGDSFDVVSYDVLCTTIEEVFLDLMSKHAAGNPRADISQENVDELEEHKPALAQGLGVKAHTSTLNLTNGRPVSPLHQALTIFHKRLLIARRSWLAPLLTIGIAVAGACIPLIFMKRRAYTCIRPVFPVEESSMYIPSEPFSSFSFQAILASPEGVLDAFGFEVANTSSSDQDFIIPDFSDGPNTGPPLPTFEVQYFADQPTFVDYIQDNYRPDPSSHTDGTYTYIPGGISLNVQTNEVLFAWDASGSGEASTNMLNLASNILYNRVLNATGSPGRPPTLIDPKYARLPSREGPDPLSTLGTMFPLRWMAFFGAFMAIYPAFFALYVSRERKSAVQEMLMSNGLSDPIGLWLGHLMFDTITVVILSTIIIVVCAAAAGPAFAGLGFLWFIMVLYGVAAALFAYCVSLVVQSPLAAFAGVAVYQLVVFALYLASYILVMTYSKATDAKRVISIIHWTISWVAPVCSVSRAAMTSVNMFDLLCDDLQPLVTTGSMGSISKFGGPILYLIASIVVLSTVIAWGNSGWRTIKDVLRRDSRRNTEMEVAVEAGVKSNQLLRVLGVSKTYGSEKVVEDVSFDLSQNSLMALLGPNGAGKTTTFNLIRGDVSPESGDVFVNHISVARNRKAARASLGYCPQFTAIDAQLSAREHLSVYGRLKGLTPGAELNENVNMILKSTGLDIYADRPANQLSGGNQRKLSLGIALIGDPAVLLIDEFSTGIDPKMKRDLWNTLREVSGGKAVLITTHSMEEASALADTVAIMAKRLLAVGSLESLASRYPIYEVQFNCNSRDDVARAHRLMKTIPGSKMADELATRFEVPIDPAEGVSLAKLFKTLSSHDHFAEYSVEKITLERVFMRVIQENNVKEEDLRVPARGWWRLGF